MDISATGFELKLEADTNSGPDLSFSYLFDHLNFS